MPHRISPYATGVASVVAGSRAVELLPGGTGRLGSRTSIGPRRAAVIDSTRSVRDIQSTLLQVHGFEVEAFADLRDAVAHCRDHPPDVVVMEPRSAGRDALAVLAQWHEAITPAAPPVVLCTTSTPSALHLSRGAELGLRGVIVKPFNLEALAALVVRVCRTDERERRLRELGVDLRSLRGPLRPHDAGLWLEVETEMAEAHGRALSLVTVGSTAAPVAQAMTSVVRNVDLVAMLDERTLAVLLPDVDHHGAAVVARRVGGAVMLAGPPVAVGSVTREPGESAADLLCRAVHAD